MGLRTVLGLLLVSSCSETPARPQTGVEVPATETSSRAEVVRAPDVELELPDPGTPKILASRILHAPEAYERVQLRAALPVGKRYENLRYEGDNRVFRGSLNDQGLYRSGNESAADWRRYAAGVKGMVVLRDSLFSQQDHPVLQAPRALMMPPRWVSVAVAAVQANDPLQSMRAPDLLDNSAWGELRTQGSVFGSFPPSATLFIDATRSLAGQEDALLRARTHHARMSLQALAHASDAMVKMSKWGAERVAETGAAHIAASDRHYFGADLRRRVIIPLFVENPNEHEARDEGKGMGVWGQHLPLAAKKMATRKVYLRRLQDGAIGIERYNLHEATERSRALALLEELVPKGSHGHKIWLWVNGGSDGHGNGDPAIPYVQAFRKQLEARNIETSRVVLLCKPSIRPWGEEGSAILERELALHKKLDLTLSLQLSTRGLRKLIEKRASSETHPTR